MSKEIQVSENKLQTDAHSQTVLTQHGDNGMQILNQGVINLIQSGNNSMLYNASIAIDTEYYNLFVVGDELFNESCFLIDKDCSLTISVGVCEDISDSFATLGPEAVSRIKTFPSLFASVNKSNGCTDDDHHALFGFVTDVCVQENGIKIYFHKCSVISQQRLNEMVTTLGIQSASLINELNRTHWSIKRINLINVLKAEGINVFPSI